MIKIGKLNAWLTLIIQMGPVARVGGQFETLNRFFVLNILKKEGLFDFLKQPKTYEEILEHFQYKEMPYTRDLFEILKNDKEKILLFSDDKKYALNPSAELPKLKDLLTTRSFEKIFQASKVPQKFAQNIPNRLKGKSKDFIEELSEPGPSLFDYDEALSHRLYTALRNTAFSFTSAKKLEGKKILDVGCGSGIETAEIWIKVKGKSKIVGVDPVASFVETAKNDFRLILEETNQRVAKNKILPELNGENMPEFHAMRAEELNFNDESFDAVFLQQILHWTNDPRKAILEIGRVLKKGGIFFGSQGTHPLNTPYMDIMIRAHERVNGFFTLEEMEKWLEEAGFEELKRTTPAGIFRTTKK